MPVKGSAAHREYWWRCRYHGMTKFRTYKCRANKSGIQRKCIECEREKYLVWKEKGRQWTRNYWQTYGKSDRYRNLARAKKRRERKRALERLKAQIPLTTAQKRAANDILAALGKKEPDAASIKSSVRSGDRPEGTSENGSRREVLYSPENQRLRGSPERGGRRRDEEDQAENGVWSRRSTPEVIL